MLRREIAQFSFGALPAAVILDEAKLISPMSASTYKSPIVSDAIIARCPRPVPFCFDEAFFPIVVVRFHSNS